MSLFGRIFPRETGPREQVGGVDPVLAAVAIALVGFGVVMVYSASAVEATVGHKNLQYFLKRQAIFAVLSMGVMWLTSRFDYRRLQRGAVTYLIYGGVTGLLLACVAGLGLGRGLQVLYLPEAHTDFIAAIIGEELGFLGICGLVAAYLLLVSRGIRTALRADDDYGSFIAFGISTLFGIQVLVNLSVAMAIVPTKGLTLPFLSYGGSSLLVNAAAVGLLLSISRRRALVTVVKPVRRKEAAPDFDASMLDTAEGRS